MYQYLSLAFWTLYTFLTSFLSEKFLIHRGSFRGLAQKMPINGLKIVKFHQGGVGFWLIPGGRGGDKGGRGINPPPPPPPCPGMSPQPLGQLHSRERAHSTRRVLKRFDSQIFDVSKVHLRSQLPPPPPPKKRKTNYILPKTVLFHKNRVTFAKP